MILLGPFYTTLGWRGSRFELSNTAENVVIKGVKPRVDCAVDAGVRSRHAASRYKLHRVLAQGVARD